MGLGFDCLGFDQTDDQRIRDAGSGIEVMFSGRLDNRADLVARLDPSNDDSDGHLALAAYRAWGADAFAGLVGPFVLVIVDPQEQKILAVRDALGDRSVYYYRDGRRLLVASELSLLLRHPDVSGEVDEVALAHYFAVEAPPPGATYFSNVQEVPPGHFAWLTPASADATRYWPTGPIEPIRYRRDEEYVEHFRDLLAQAVRCRLPNDGDVAVLMSGGLDSTSVAAMAATEFEASGRSVHSISWVFDELERADERRFIEPVVRQLGLRAHYVFGDDEWPLRDLATWPVREEAPWQGPYCRLQQSAYRVSRENGARVLLTGELGDQIFADAEFWLRDLLTDHGPSAALRALRAEVAERGVASILRSGPVRSAMSRAVGWRGRRPAPPPWLTPSAQALVVETRESLRREGFPLPAREFSTLHPRILDPMGALASSLAQPAARQAGIDLRRPYRDRRLIEFALGIPAHLLRRPGWTKWILRQAMRGHLPDPVRERRYVSSLLPLTARGLVEREAARVDEILRRPDAVWRRYVDTEWLMASFPRRLRAGLDGVESVIAWQCLCGQLWLDRWAESRIRLTSGLRRGCNASEDTL